MGNEIGLYASLSSNGHTRNYAVSAPGNAAVPPRSGLSLPIAEAESFLIDEGLPRAAIDSFLADFRQLGSVHQSSLFDFLADWSDGALEESGVSPLESSPPAPHTDEVAPDPADYVNPPQQKDIAPRGAIIAQRRQRRHL